MLKLLHVVDDQKFHAYIKATFDLPEIENLIVGSHDLINYNNTQVQIFDHVIIHYLNHQKAKWLNSVSPKNVIWFIWGGDIHNLAKFRNNVHLSQTSKILDSFKKNYKRTKFFKDLNSKYFPFIFDYIFNKYKIKALKKVDVAIPVLPADYDILKDCYSFNSPVFYMNYLTPNLEKLQENRVNGNNILCGNSAHPTNNHLEIIDLIKNAKISKGRKVILPLNYGNTRYKQVLIEEVKEIKYPEFVILNNLIPLDDYIQTLKTCNVMVFNNLRQQAIGTILHGLMLGSHIYMNENSPQFKFFKSEGFIVSRLDVNSTFNPLIENEIQHNRQRVNEIYGNKNNKLKVRELLNI